MAFDLDTCHRSSVNIYLNPSFLAKNYILQQNLKYLFGASVIFIIILKIFIYVVGYRIQLVLKRFDAPRVLLLISLCNVPCCLLQLKLLDNRFFWPWTKNFRGR